MIVYHCLGAILELSESIYVWQGMVHKHDVCTWGITENEKEIYKYWLPFFVCTEYWKKIGLQKYVFCQYKKEKERLLNWNHVNIYIRWMWCVCSKNDV